MINYNKGGENMKTKKEIAEYFSVSVTTIDNRMKKGLPYIKIGKSVRFDIEEVINWFKENTIK